MIVNVLIGLVAAIVVVGFFGLTVFFHEFGHFLAARALGLRVDAFSIGFGPSIVERKVGNTTYKIGWIPFGGYVALPQLDPTGMAQIQGEHGEPVEVPPASWWKRIAVSLAGPFGNIILAFILAFIIAAAPTPELAPGLGLGGVVVGQVTDGSAAAVSGLRRSDQILSVEGKAVDTWDEFVTECHLVSGGQDRSVVLVVSNRVDGAVRQFDAPLSEDKRNGYHTLAGIGPITLCTVHEIMPDMPAVDVLEKGDIIIEANGEPIYGSEDFIAAVQASEGRPVSMQVLRDKKALTLQLQPRHDAELGRWLVGMRPVDVVPAIRPWMKYRRPWLQVKGDAQSIGRMLQALFAPKHKGESGQVREAVAGPIFILAQMWIGLLQSLVSTLGFVRFLNVNLAVINLLPFPVLDGGHIMFALYEGITRRRVPPRLLNWLVNVFAALIIGLAIFLSLRDTLNLKKVFSRKPDPVEQTEEISDVADEGAPLLIEE